jgi:large subunit ribosomal protein L4
LKIRVLFVVDQFEENVILASRNLQNVALISSDEVNVLDIVNSDVMVMTEKALKDVEEVLK